MPHWIGERMPAGGGRDGVRPEQLADEAVGRVGDQPDPAAGRVTRASSRAVRSWSGANIAPNTELTTSKLPSAKGRSSASPTTNSASSPSASTRRRARSSRAGT